MMLNLLYSKTKHNLNLYTGSMIHRSESKDFLYKKFLGLGGRLGWRGDRQCKVGKQKPKEDI